MIQQIKQSTVKCLHDTAGSDKKFKGKRKKRCKVQSACVWRGLVVM